MKSESGHMKVIGNFRKLIDWITAEINYKPSNAPLKPPAMETQYASALAAIEAVAEKHGPYKAALTERKVAFDSLSKKSRQIRNVAKASGASAEALANLDTPLHKLLGERVSPKVKGAPGTPEDDAGKQHSASQMSFDNRVGNFATLLSLVGTMEEYNPNEPELKLTALQAFAEELTAKNNAVNTAFVPLSQARALRDQLLYTDDNSILNVAMLAKAYVKGVLGLTSHLYQQIKGLKFGKRS
jgi:hypothetical protein